MWIRTEPSFAVPSSRQMGDDKVDHPTRGDRGAAMTIFAQKLSTLVETVRLSDAGPREAIAAALSGSAGRAVVAIGSGGSAIAAEYLAHCRSTLGHCPTVVATPMDYVISRAGYKEHDVWLLSAGASNPDSAAALEAALGSGCRQHRTVARKPAGRDGNRRCAKRPLHGRRRAGRRAQGRVSCYAFARGHDNVPAGCV